MLKYLIYKIEYNKRNEIYYLWKYLVKNELVVAYLPIFKGSKEECNKYAKKNKIILNEKIFK